MARRKTVGTAGPGDLAETIPLMPEQLLRVPVDELVPYARNARTHSDAQIAQLRASLREFGFVSPVLIDSQRNIIAGHGRVMAARAEGMSEVPCVMVEHLSDSQRRAYILADNRLAEAAGWDMELVALELGELQAAGFDLVLTGFDEMELVIDPGTMPVGLPASHASAAQHKAGDSTVEADAEELAARAFEAGMEAAEAGEVSEEYAAFVEKFKPKKTTDDCYTPAPVYEAVRAWAVQKFGLDDRPVVRPFYPGGDYQQMTYPDSAVVIDNPPFSILTQIVDFYHAHGIDFFLFCPGLTAFSPFCGRDWLHSVIAHAGVTYANGARVCTSFLTNLGAARVTLSPELHNSIEDASRAAQKTSNGCKQIPKYCYPDAVATSAGLGYLVQHGIAMEIMPESCAFVSQLDSQKDAGKTIYGCGLLLSAKSAAEKAAAEKAAAEKAAAIRWPLSDREMEIIGRLK